MKKLYRLRKKLSEAALRRPKRLIGNNRGKHWFNNGVENRVSTICPKGFKPGMLSRSK